MDTRITEDSVKALLGGHWAGACVHKENSFEFWNREASKEEELHRVFEHPVGSARSCLSK
jgi:hypothetical protein